MTYKYSLEDGTLEKGWKEFYPIPPVFSLQDGTLAPKWIDKNALTSKAITTYERVKGTVLSGEFPAPQILCNVSGGGVEFQWEKRNYSLEIEIIPDGSIQYFTDKNDDMISEDVPIETEADFIRNLIRDFVNA